MPPKAAGRPKRTLRSTARKSVPPPVADSLSSPSQQQQQQEPPPPSDDVALKTQSDKIRNDGAPLESVPAPEIQNDVGSEARVEDEVAQPQCDAVLVETETLAEPVKEEESKEIAGGGGADSNANENNNGGNNKQKKVVKKTVKVVKKVVKRVPKRVLKGETDPNKAENLTASVQVEDSKGEAETEVDCKIENLGANLEVEDVKQASSSGDQSNVEGYTNNLDDSGGLKVEEQVKKIEIDVKKDGSTSEVQEEEKKEKEKEKGKGSELMEVDDSDKGVVQKKDDECGNENDDKDGVEMEQVKNMEIDEKEKGSELMEADKNDKGVVEKGDGECGNESDEKIGVEKEGKEEDEVGEGKLFRGELEAMERRKKRKTEIFIGGLDKDAKEEDVRKVFEEVGEIVELTVVMNAQTGKNKGFAFVRYASAADAKRALEKFANVEICGKQCHAMPAEGNDTIFLGNIDKKWKDEDVVKLLQEIGIEKIDTVTVMIDPNKSGCNRGFAFVEFETSRDAQLAYKKLQKNGVFGKNRNIKVAWAEPLKELDEEEILKVKTVYAEFIPSSWDKEKVRDTFKKFGDVDDVVLARNLRTTKRKDFAFISYKTREAAIKCIESFSDDLRDENGTKVNVKVSLAKPMQKDKKQKPAPKPVSKEVPNKKPKTSHINLRPSDPRNRAQPTVPHYTVQISERSSTNAELVHLLREQAPWRPSHAPLSNSPVDIRYSNSLPGRKRQFPMLEADPLYPDPSRYRYSHLDASFPVASSSHNVVRPSGLTSSLDYHQQHHGHPSGSFYGARNYLSNSEIRDQAHGSNFLYRRY